MSHLMYLDEPLFDFLLAVIHELKSPLQDNWRCTSSPLKEADLITKTTQRINPPRSSKPTSTIDDVHRLLS